NLPHLQPPEGTFFITYRLFGSIPTNIISELKEQHKQALAQIQQEHRLVDGVKMDDLPPPQRQVWEAIIQKKEYLEGKKHFKRLDDFLDTNLNEPHWLKKAEIAELVKNSLHHFENQHYRLWAYTIMANHVHALLTMLPGAPILWKVLQDSKKFTGRQANRLLGREGQFWEEESYDHLIRANWELQVGEFDRILWYILNNPVKAGLVKEWQDWAWSFSHPELLAG
ncbi:MAG: hypothetical protein AAB316_14265, partial [Bacteroidota bacterium]